jgi:acyl carrier protein
VQLQASSDVKIDGDMSLQECSIRSDPKRIGHRRRYARINGGHEASGGSSRPAGRRLEAKVKLTIQPPPSARRCGLTRLAQVCEQLTAVAGDGLADLHIILGIQLRANAAPFSSHVSQTEHGITSMKLHVRQLVHDVVGRKIKMFGDADSLFDAGLSSHDATGLLTAIEEASDIEFPDHLLQRDTFSSVEAIAMALEKIGVKSMASHTR